MLCLIGYLTHGTVLGWKLEIRQKLCCWAIWYGDILKSEAKRNCFFVLYLPKHTS